MSHLSLVMVGSGWCVLLILVESRLGDTIERSGSANIQIKSSSVLLLGWEREGLCFSVLRRPDKTELRGTKECEVLRTSSWRTNSSSTLGHLRFVLKRTVGRRPRAERVHQPGNFPWEIWSWPWSWKRKWFPPSCVTLCLPWVCPGCRTVEIWASWEMQFEENWGWRTFGVQKQLPQRAGDWDIFLNKMHTLLSN